MRRNAPTMPLATPVVFAVVNATAFCLVRPGVPDLWAARARASAAAHGVGLTYWFSWFGGSTPGDYSVITPFLCALAGTEVVAAGAAVATCVIATALVADTPRATAAAWVATTGVVINLWCGRVPFLLGAAFAVASLLLVRHRRPAGSAALAVLSVLASPVSGGFLVLALSGVLLTPRMRDYRTAAGVAAGFAAGTLVLIEVLFGSPGPEPFPTYLLVETGVAITLMLLLAPSSYLRVTLVVSALAALAVFSVPNGLGANFARLALFCLPAAAVALSRRRRATVVVLVTPILVLGGLTSVSAARSAAGPASHASYYAALAGELDTRADLGDHRVELVSTAWAAYTALAGHAMLARGWETQSLRALDAQLTTGGLDAGEYRAWLDENAVGYVAIDTDGTSATPEAHLVDFGDLPYLRPLWSHAGWRLYRVLHPTSIIDSPATVVAWSQAALRVHVPRAGESLVRIRWSRFLTASRVQPDGTPGDLEDRTHPYLAPGPDGWTTLVTEQPGTYTLTGLL